MMISKGQKINDRYEIIRLIGEGGMANVYLAYDIILDRKVAVKVLRGDLAEDEKFVRRFQREAIAASSLNHPNIVEVYDVGEDDGKYFIVMEYVDGKTLKSLVKKRGALTLPEVIDIMLQLTSAIGCAHESYIIHRDIKPQNVIILEDGRVKVMDFGIAAQLNSNDLTQTNSVMGTVYYLPPEQANGNVTTAKSDIYSLGILMYELVVGKVPFKGDSPVEVAIKQMRDRIPDITAANPDIPQSIENIILRATAKNPKNRYADAREMNEDLKTCLDESRANELKISFKYPENDYDDTKILKAVKVADKEKNKKDGEEVIAKKITKNDLGSQNKILIVLGSIFVSLVVIITTIFVLIPYITKNKQDEIPDVTGMSVTSAIKTLQDAGFAVSDEQIEEPSDSVEEGRVTKTSPAAGSRRKEGFEVKLYVSVGDTKITIEDYTNKNCIEIKSKLDTLGLYAVCEPEKIEQEDSDLYKENLIIHQSVKPGEKLSAGDYIYLYIPELDTKYPNFLEEAYTREDVEAYAEEMGLILRVQEVETEDYPEGSVFEQSRKPGDPVISGARLIVKVAKAPNNDNDENVNPDDGSNLE